MRRYVSRRDMAVLGGILTAVIAGAALLMVAIYGPQGALRQITGSAAPATTSTPPITPPPPGASPGDTASFLNCPGSTSPTDFRLIIPKLHVDAHTESLGFDAQGNLDTPKGKFCNVGWYARGPSPGAPGNAVVDGHLDWDGKPAVFWELGSLKPGDELIVHRDGAVLHFKVDALTSVPYDAHPTGLYSISGGPRMTLITCGGDYDFKKATYLKRILVNASFVSRTA